MKIIKKISPKTVTGGIDLGPEGKGRHLCNIYGIVTKVSLTETAFGEAVKFNGDFEAVDAATGEMYRSATCYLPSPADEMLESAFSQSDSGQVEFGYGIYTAPSEASKTGYEYRIEPLVTRDSDPLEELRGVCGC